MTTADDCERSGSRLDSSRFLPLWVWISIPRLRRINRRRGTDATPGGDSQARFDAFFMTAGRISMRPLRVSL